MCLYMLCLCTGLDPSRIWMCCSTLCLLYSLPPKQNNCIEPSPRPQEVPSEPSYHFYVFCWLDGRLNVVASWRSYKQIGWPPKASVGSFGIRLVLERYVMSFLTMRKGNLLFLILSLILLFADSNNAVTQSKAASQGPPTSPAHTNTRESLGQWVGHLCAFGSEQKVKKRREETPNLHLYIKHKMWDILMLIYFSQDFPHPCFCDHFEEYWVSPAS